MKLYHGTTARYLKTILTQGLTPRDEGEGNWEEYPSRDDLVYLTTAYPFYFGFTPTEEGEDILVVETDTEYLFDEKMLPDEDFIAQIVSRQLEVSLDSVHDDVRRQLEVYREHTEDSLTGLGNCAYKGVIAPDQITRYCIFNPRVRPQIAMDLLSPSISLLNYQILGESYRAKVAWMFGDREDYPVFDTMFAPDDADAEMTKFFNDRKVFWDAESMNREGIVVVDVV